MQIAVLGINYKSTDLAVRELVAKAAQSILSSDCLEAARFSVVLLSTCNRTEIYFSAEDLAAVHSYLLMLLRRKIHVPFEQKLYAFFGGECFVHLAKVISGFDSVIFGETEIQRQVKTAYAVAASAYTLHAAIHFLFQKCLKIGKEIRSSFALPRGMLTLESLIFNLSRMPTATFFIGNSDINRKILSFFKMKKVSNLSLCTHQPVRAQEMSVFSEVEVLPFSAISHWQKYEVVIAGSSSAEYLLVPEQIDRSVPFKTRLVFDLSMPRTVNPQLERHPHVHLLNIQDLGDIIALKRKVRLQDIRDAENSMRSAVERQLQLFHLKGKKSYLCA